jgi:transposase-like protein
MAGKLDITNPIFHDEDAARDHLESLPWPGGPVCPRCGVTGARITKMQGKSLRPGVYNCKDCRKPLSVTVGTVMERSHVPLAKWALAAQLMASSKKGFSANELHRLLGTNYETAWFLFHRLREAATDPKAGPLGGENRSLRQTRPISAARKATSTSLSASPACRAARARCPLWPSWSVVARPAAFTSPT